MMKVTIAILVKKSGAHQRLFSGSNREEIKHTLTKLYKKKVNIVEDSSTELWYKYFGYMSKKEHDILGRKKYFHVKDTLLNAYTHYLIGKQHWFVFYRSSLYRRSHALNFIHIDVCTIDTKTLSGVLYFVIFFYDHCRMCRLMLWNSKIRCLMCSSIFILVLKEK